MNINSIDYKKLQNRSRLTEQDYIKLGLLESEIRYRELFENSPNCIVIYQEGKISLVNPEAMKKLGGNKINLIGNSVMDFIHSEDQIKIEHRIAEILKGHNIGRMECRLITFDGKEIFADIRGSKITFDGKPAVKIVAQDITEQKIASLKRAESEAQYRNFIELLPNSVLVHQEGKIVYVNSDAIKTLGAKHEDDLLGKSLLELVFDDKVDIVKERIARVSNGEKIPTMEYKVKTLDGRVIDVESNIFQILFNGKSALITVGKDITEKRRLEEQLIESEQRYKSLFEYNANSVYSFDLNGYFTSCNDICEDLTGYSKQKILEPMHFYDFIIPEDKEQVNHHFEQCKKGIPQKFRTTIYHKNNSLIYLDVTIVPIIVNGQINGIFGIAQDITKLIETEKEIKHMAYHDYLTGLPNRNMLNKHLINEVANASEGKNFAILSIDLDRFKNINDTLGHNFGDQLLKKVAKRLKSSLKNNDIVFRQAGDEFNILLEDADRKVAEKVARQILNVLSVPFNIQNYDIFTTPSIGIGLFPEDGQTSETLIKNAELAMYQAKSAGKNQYKFYSLSNQKLEVNPLQMEMDLHKAIEQEELLLHYQPKVNLKTGKIVGVESLIRWNHPLLGMISPGSFIPMAEETGLIIPIGDWALYSACKQNKKWHQNGFITTVSVNLSARQFTQSNLVETVASVLRDTGLEPQYLELEITESMTADIQRTLATLQKLKKLGVRVSIDDFGTGFSSLNYLKQFPVDTLKIDQSFIRELHNNPNDETIVKTIISMAHNMNMNVVAEGIETKEQLVFLQQHLCDEGQGYFFTKPLSANKLEEKFLEIQNVVREFGLPYDINERIWSKELVRMARKELNDTIRLQQGMTFKFKKINGQFIHTLCNGELMYRLGQNPSEVIGKQLSDFLPEDIAKEKEQYYQRAWNGEEHVTYESELNGIYYLAALSPIKRGGEVVEVIASCVDITNQKKVEEALRNSEYKYRLIAENMSDLIILFDINGICIYASPSHKSILGYSPEYFEGNNTISIIHPEDAPSSMMNFEQIIITKSPSKIEHRLLHANGEWILIECVAIPVIDRDGEVEHIMVIGKDITEKRKAEELLWKSEKLSLVGELAAGVAHEIRNPITSIKGFIQLFRKGLMKDEYFEITLKEFDRIEKIIKEFLSLAKPQDIQLSEVSFPHLVKEVEILLESEARLRNVQFFTKIEQELPLISCDPNQIKQVLINICKNSIEAIDDKVEGIIKIIIFIEKANLVMKVVDNGVGISEERVQRLGEPFYSNKEKGTGLGLMLCFKIIKEHNGMINFKSKENKGTTVEIRLPLSN